MKTAEDPSSVPTQPSNGEVPSSTADTNGCQQVNGDDGSVEHSKKDEKTTQGSTADESSNGSNTEMQSFVDEKVTADDPVPNGHDAAVGDALTVEQDSKDGSHKESNKQEGAEVEMVKEAAATGTGDATAETLQNGANGKEQEPTQICVDKTTNKPTVTVNGCVPGSGSVAGDSGNDQSIEEPLTSTSGVSNTGEAETNGTAS